MPGPRDVRATLDEPATDEGWTAGSDGDTDRCVVACPPHPQHGGSRSDRRLRAVSAALTGRGVACLRIDYGSWDEGTGERADAARALDWAGKRYDAVGPFGYSFGGAVALLVAAERADLRAVAALAPAPGLPNGADAAGALGRVEAPTLVVCGERDDTVDCERVATAARAAGKTVERLPADHHFVGGTDAVADTVGPFLAEHTSPAGPE